MKTQVKNKKLCTHKSSSIFNGWCASAGSCLVPRLLIGWSVVRVELWECFHPECSAFRCLTIKSQAPSPRPERGGGGLGTRNRWPCVAKNKDFFKLVWGSQTVKTLR